jgi:hypothetical protein
MLKLGRKILSFRKRIVAIVVGVTMVTLSLLFTNDMARRLREKEQHEVALWVHAMERVMSDSSNDPFVQDILSQRNNIPFIITNQNLKVLHSHLIPEEIINHPDRLRKKINQLTEENTPITIQYYWGKDHKHIIFFGQSRLLKTLYWFPYIQLSVIAIFILLGFIASARPSRTSRTAYGSDWPKKRRTNWAPPPPRCWDGSNTCARSPSIRVPSKR